MVCSGGILYIFAILFEIIEKFWMEFYGLYCIVYACSEKPRHSFPIVWKRISLSHFIYVNHNTLRLQKLIASILLPNSLGTRFYRYGVPIKIYFFVKPGNVTGKKSIDRFLKLLNHFY